MAAKSSKTAKEKKPKKAVELSRPPVVALLGHVDHGKTTILDQIRQTSEQEKEVGGITQSITGWTVNYDNQDITFIDTPGHEAFDLMRTRGGEVADIVLLIVAVDAGVKPQTKESIEIIKNTKTSCIVVLNKIDIKGADKEKVKRDLSNEGIAVESLGGDVPCVEVSGKTGKGIPELLEMIVLVSQMSDLKERELPENICGLGFVLETTKDKSRGNMSSVVVTSGQFAKGNYGVFKVKNIQTEKMKGFLDSSLKPIDIIKSGYCGSIIGLSEVLDLGDLIYCSTSSKGDFSTLFKEQLEPVQEDEEEKGEESSQACDEEVTENPSSDLLSMIFEAGEETQSENEALRVIVKSCSKGTLEAVVKSIKELNEEEKSVEIMSSGVGAISLSDIEFAKTVGAFVIGFSVPIDSDVENFAAKSRVLVKVYDLIYDLIDELEDAASAMKAPETEEVAVGTGKVKQIFVLSNGTKVVGMRVESGEFKHGLNIRIRRGEDIVGEGKIMSMQCEKDKVKSAGTGADCGVVISGENDAQEGDVTECFRIKKV